jgi:hypothetical protein
VTSGFRGDFFAVWLIGAFLVGFWVKGTGVAHGTDCCFCFSASLRSASSFAARIAWKLGFAGAAVVTGVGAAASGAGGAAAGGFLGFLAWKLVDGSCTRAATLSPPPPPFFLSAMISARVRTWNPSSDCVCHVRMKTCTRWEARRSECEEVAVRQTGPDILCCDATSIRPRTGL